MVTADELRLKNENQIFDRKSIRIEPKALAIAITAFANADGGVIAIGITDDGQIEGINGYEQKINEILRVPFDFCKPTAKVDFEYIDCIDRAGNSNRIFLINVFQSKTVQTNQADEVYYRVGDKSKKLSFDERLQLMYDKGDMLYENNFLKGARIEDIDMSLVKQYAELLQYTKSDLDFLSQALGVIERDSEGYKISVAAMLLFGNSIHKFFPCSRVRILRYEGIEEKTGQQMNIVKDITFDGPIIQMLQKSLDFIQTQIKEYTWLHDDGKFHTIPEYPEFVWKEAIVNAVAHRDYHILGTDIQVKMLDDRLVIESPGSLPGLVRLNNIRNMHFSRNPRIAKYLRDYKFVRELGEGVDRMYKEMFKAGLPDPEYKVQDFMTILAVKKFIRSKRTDNELINEPINELINELIKESIKNDTSDTELLVFRALKEDGALTILGISKQIDRSESSVKRVIASLKEKGAIKRKGSNKNGTWVIVSL